MSSFSKSGENASLVAIRPVLPRENAAPEQSSQMSHWPRILNACLQAVVLVIVLVIVGLLSHTLRNYSGSRDIHFGTDAANSWPKDLNLVPAYTFLTLAAASALVSLALALHQGWLVRRKSHSFTLGERASALSAFLGFVFWLAADGIQAKSEGTPKKDLLKWACKRYSSPTNVLVSYDSICQEQVSTFHREVNDSHPIPVLHQPETDNLQLAVKDLAIIITLIQAGIVLVAFITWRHARLLTENASRPWKIRASAVHGQV